MTLQGFRLELAPTPEQAGRLSAHEGLHRVVFNHCLARVKAVMDQRAAERSYGIVDADLTPVQSWSGPGLEKYWRETAATYPWFAGERMSSRVPKEACRSLAAALSNWSTSKAGARRGRKVGFPGFRRRKDGGRFRMDSDRIHPTGARAMHIPAVGVVRTREDATWLTGRLAEGRARILGGAASRVAGRWWVSFQVEVDRTDINAHHRAPTDGPVVGIDLGIKTYATIASSDGTVVEVANPRHLARAQRKLARLNKALARTQRGSANRAKAVRKVAQVHLDVAHARADFGHKFTTELARTKSVIVVEDLHVAGMVKNRRLARAISDAGWATVLHQLAYKAAWYGSRLVVADRWFPSSRLCSACGVINTELTLADRVWTCPCGIVHDRDVTAARNLLGLVA
ncbi:RNA-guided endonuclease TnpB family protein [Sanguibacter gelidistatuariae]|nr:RNA-guided endonuclease TnpB family protein [Sanguibacter gelidistatuariae]